MLRALTTLAAVAALAVSASPALAAQPRPQDFNIVRWAKAAPTPSTFGAGKDRGWFKATPEPPQGGASGFTKVLGRDGRLAGFRDGTSNTVLLGEGLVGQLERGKGGRVGPPKPSAIHENEGIDGGF